MLAKIITLLPLLALLSCKKQITSSQLTTVPTTFSDVFDEFWKSMNSNYVYWDIDTTNWDEVYKNYKPIFTKLSLNSIIDQKKSINYFRQITHGLIDSHFAISFTPPILKDSFLFPAANKKIKQSSFHNPFLYSKIDSNYLDKGFFLGTYLSRDQQQMFVMSGTINKTILYFTCNQFELQESYQSFESNNAKLAIEFFFNQLKAGTNRLKGVIIDVRGNTGGNIEDLNFLISHFISSPLKFGYTRYKNGSGRLDYTPWIAAEISPSILNNVSVRFPVEILADAYSISLAEIFAMVVHSMSNGIFIGETTWGATGPITETSVYNDGPFNVPNFLSVFTSSSEFKYIDGEIYEGKGFPPDVLIPFNLTELLSGKDAQLEKAIELLQ